MAPYDEAEGNLQNKRKIEVFGYHPVDLPGIIIFINVTSKQGWLS